MYRTFLASFIALILAASLTTDSHAQVPRGNVRVPVQPRILPIPPWQFWPYNPFVPMKTYPLATPYSVWSQAAAVQLQQQALHDSFRAQVYSMAYQNNYSPYQFNPYFQPPYIPPYYGNNYATPYTPPYYGGSYSSPAYGNYAAPPYGYGAMNPVQTAPNYGTPAYTADAGQPKQPPLLTAFAIPNERGRVKWPTAFRLMSTEEKKTLLDPLEAQLQIVTSQAVAGQPNPLLVKEARVHVAALQEWLRARRPNLDEPIYSEGDTLLRRLDATLQRMQGEH